MRELTAVRDIPKEVYEHVLSDISKIEPKYSTIHKYGQIPQSKVHKDNEACLKFSSLPKIFQEQIILFHIISSESRSLI